jgi:hypothetical protein
VAIDYVKAFSPVGPLVDGRLIFGGTMGPEAIQVQNPIRLPLVRR